MVVTYRKEKNQQFKFEVAGKGVQGYVALGLSTDNKMGDDSVMACIKGV